MNQNFVYQESLSQKLQGIETDLLDSNNHDLYISLSNQQKNSNYTSQSEFNFIHNNKDEYINQQKNLKKQKAFQNFSQSKSQFQYNQKLQITLFDNNLRVELEELEKNKKSVRFNLENNKINLITNFDSDYYMSCDERKLLYQPFSIHKQQILIEEEDQYEEDEDDSEQFMLSPNTSIKVIVIHDKTLKGILKQNIEKVDSLQSSKDFVMNISQQSLKFSQETTVTKKQKEVLEKKIQDHQYGVGFKFLQKYGFECGSGLGLQKQGILEPVQTQNSNFFYENFENRQKCLDHIQKSTNRKKRKIQMIALSDDDQELCLSNNQKSC
ncbi:unnamed protein product [Paramecium sonneborni]|uniref:G-patch domain-containing protein n=1 Tax=Paramecium sonneborni TaxID=65129 RepID=A0A8S1MBY2_9CILI|nr:unnamed protein product [Paramecium sonneborni]